MRLINAGTKQLEEFVGSDIPRYAILSHTWGRDEVSFRDLRDYNRRSATKRVDVDNATSDDASPAKTNLNDGLPSEKPGGWAKIVGTCKLALEHELEYAWIDTCCIDKTSSTELQEAINSMFRWYKDSVICFAYLSDIERRRDASTKEPDAEALVGSRWFTRGWTLQELLAPKSLNFYDQHWHLLGTLSTFCEAVSKRTGISEAFLRPPKKFDGSPGEKLALAVAGVAERFSWAADRQTTRVEDRAYSLLGIFGINMPLLYGEGQGAFERLQEEIMKVNDDTTILAWGFREYSKYYTQDVSGGPVMLARSPDDYRNCGKHQLSLHDYPDTGIRRPELSITPRGIRGDFSTFSTCGSHEKTKFLLLVLGVKQHWSISKGKSGGILLVLPVYVLSESPFLPSHATRHPRGLHRQADVSGSDVCVRFPWAKPEYMPLLFLHRLGKLAHRQVTIARPTMSTTPTPSDLSISVLPFPAITPESRPTTSTTPPDLYISALPFRITTPENRLDPMTGVYPYPVKLVRWQVDDKPTARPRRAWQRNRAAESPSLMAVLRYQDSEDCQGNVFHRFEVPGMPRNTALAIVVTYDVHARPSNVNQSTLRVFCTGIGKVSTVEVYGPVAILDRFWDRGHHTTSLTDGELEGLDLCEIPPRDGALRRVRDYDDVEAVDQDFFVLPSDDPAQLILTLAVTRRLAEVRDGPAWPIQWTCRYYEFSLAITRSSPRPSVDVVVGDQPASDQQRMDST